MKRYFSTRDEFDHLGFRRHDERFVNGYEMVRAGDLRTPQDHPYSFDAYWVWHEELKDQSLWSADYADRYSLWPGYRERYDAALECVGRPSIMRHSGPEFSREQTMKIVEIVYEGQKIATGLANCCNVSSGYPILIFYYRDAASAEVKP